MAILQLLMSASAALATAADVTTGCSIHYAVPSTLAADSAAATPVTLIGVGFSSAGPGGNVSCHVRGGLFGSAEYQVAQFVQGRVVNDTAMQCRSARALPVGHLTMNVVNTAWQVARG